MNKTEVMTYTGPKYDLEGQFDWAKQLELEFSGPSRCVWHVIFEVYGFFPEEYVIIDLEFQKDSLGMIDAELFKDHFENYLQFYFDGEAYSLDRETYQINCVADIEFVVTDDAIGREMRIDWVGFEIHYKEAVAGS